MAGTAGRYGYPTISNLDPMQGPAQITAAAGFWDSFVGETAANVGALPAAATRAPGHTIMALDTLWVYVSDGTTWQVSSTPWMTYTPVWTAAGGTTAMGASVLTGRYQQSRNMTDFSIYFKLGTGSSQGTGDWRFTLPVTAAPSSSGNARVPVAATIENSSVGFYTGTGFIDPSGTIVSHIAMNSGVGHMAGGTGGPTWQPNSVIALRGRYQV